MAHIRTIMALIVPLAGVVDELDADIVRLDQANAAKQERAAQSGRRPRPAQVSVAKAAGE